MPTMPTSDAKAAEFARLFSLFDRLASRRARTTTASTNDNNTTDNERDERQRLLPLPDDFSPVLKNLSTIAAAGMRKPRLEYTRRPRRNTLASISGSRHASDMSAASASGESAGSDIEGGSDVDEESLAQFPLADEKNYPFTFKHMVHKLYPKDDWARAVKELLEKSKNEFKPLAEQLEAEAKGSAEKENDENGGKGVEEEEGVVRFKVPTSPGAGRRGSVFGGTRQRSQSIIGGASRAISPLPTRSPGSGLQPEVRALKKRCVGRRSSMSGPLNAFGETGTSPAGTIGGGWVYAAAISSAEHPTAATFSSFPPAPPPSPTTETSFEKYGALGGGGKPNLPSTLQGRGGVKRRVSAGNPGTMIPLQMLASRNVNVERQIVRKRAMRVDTTEEGSQEGQAKMKRAI